jgi:hypothetical protein
LRTAAAAHFRDIMIAAAINLTGRTITASELFVVLMLLFLIAVLVWAGVEREE